MAQVIEPDYELEKRYLKAELAFAKRKLATTRHSWPSWPNLGILARQDWQHYAHKLETYEHQLDKYAQAVQEGVLPVKFAVYNPTKHADNSVHVKVKIANGTISQTKQPPSRPERIDKGGHNLPKLTIPKITSFRRTGVRITEHTISAELSQLNACDGATLVNQLLHVNCGPDTRVSFEISSYNMPHEQGEVMLQQTTEPA